jgi:hypothetical protein
VQMTIEVLGDESRYSDVATDVRRSLIWIIHLAFSFFLRLAKMREIRPELTLRRSYGDAALSRVSLGEPWARLTPRLTLVKWERGEPILSFTGPTWARQQRSSPSIFSR